jgi:arginase
MAIVDHPGPPAVWQYSDMIVPYHLDEYLPALATGPDVLTVTFPSGDVWTRLGHLQSAVASAVADAGDGPVVVVSGDCMMPLGIMAGLQRKGTAPSVVWFDGHGDLQTLETTTSGYAGGMTLRLLVGYRPSLIADRLGLSAVPESRILLVDARDLDPPEVTYLASSAIRRCDVSSVEDGVLPDGPLVLHVDLDVVDPSELPGLRFPAADGPSASVVVDAARRVLDTGRVAALSVGCTWRPDQPDTTGIQDRLLSDLTSRTRPGGGA